ncbi:MAG: hypothetical protein ACFB16_24890 [Phormidesmis sp.]
MLKRQFGKITLATLCLGFCVGAAAANAAPAPLFDTVIDDIHQELPEGWQFRLPETIPAESKLYPFISESSETKFIVSLGITPDCAESNCTIGMIGATDSAAELNSWPPEGNDVSTFVLGNDIQGYHLIRGEGESANRLVMWQQDDLTYAIATLAEAVTQDQLVEVARSTAFETPISR